jgi:hypothetical protein
METEQLKKINKIFDQQIKQDKKFEVHKELFNLTFDFTIDDWKFIRTEKYWQTMDALAHNAEIDALVYDAKQEYTLKCVKYYLKNFRRSR